MYTKDEVAVSWPWRKRLIMAMCAVAILIVNVVPAHAQPIVNEIVKPVAAVQTNQPLPGPGGHNTYFPYISRNQCYLLVSLAPTGEDDECAALESFVGAQGPGSLVTTIVDGIPEMFAHDMPHTEVVLPLAEIHIAPQDAGTLSANIIQLSAMAYMTDTEEAAAAGVNASGPMAARMMWVIIKALQKKSAVNPILFPVSIAQIHYSQANKASLTATIFQKCGDKLNAGQLSLPGFPYDFQADGPTATGGNVWLQMHYPACPAISSYWIRLADFYQGLKAFPGYEQIDQEAAAMVGPSTYHVTALPMRGPDGQQVLVAATIVVIVVGVVVLVVILPEVGVGWWILSGAAALSVVEVKQQEVYKLVP